MGRKTHSLGGFEGCISRSSQEHCQDTRAHIDLIIDGADSEKAQHAIQKMTEAETPYDLIITNNFFKQKGADQILQFVVSQEADRRSPVIVGISLPNPYSEE